MPLCHPRLNGYIGEILAVVHNPIHAVQINHDAIALNGNSRTVTPILPRADRIDRYLISVCYAEALLDLLPRGGVKDGGYLLVGGKRGDFRLKNAAAGGYHIALA